MRLQVSLFKDFLLGIRTLDFFATQSIKVFSQGFHRGIKDVDSSCTTSDSRQPTSDFLPPLFSPVPF